MLQADSWSLTTDLPDCFIVGAVRSDLRVRVNCSSLSASCAWGANNKVSASLHRFAFHISKTSAPEKLTVAALLKCPTEQSIWTVKYPVKQLYSHWYYPLSRNSNLIWGSLWEMKIQRCKCIENWLINCKQFWLPCVCASQASPHLTESGTLASVSACCVSMGCAGFLRIRYAEGK